MRSVEFGSERKRSPFQGHFRAHVPVVRQTVMGVGFSVLDVRGMSQKIEHLNKLDIPHTISS